MFRRFTYWWEMRCFIRSQVRVVREGLIATGIERMTRHMAESEAESYATIRTLETLIDQANQDVAEQERKQTQAVLDELVFQGALRRLKK